MSIGSAPLAPPTLLKLQERMPQATVSNSYGMTEAGPAFIMMPKDEVDQADRLGRQAGRADGGARSSTRRPTTDCDAATRSASCSSACRASSASTTRTTPRPRATWTADGWLRSGDLAYLDEDGFLYISGRKKDMIIRGGNNIYPTDVEAVILEHPDVQEAAVDRRPAPGARRGRRRVRRAASPAPTLDDDDAARVLRRAARRLQAPAPGAAFVDELPRNATGKVMKHKLVEAPAGTDAPSRARASLPGRT